MSDDATLYLTAEEISGRWRVSKMTIYRMIESGEIPASVFGRQFRIKLADVIEHEKNSVYVPEEEATG